MADLEKETPAIKWLCYLEGPCAKERPLASGIGIVCKQEAQHATPKTLSTHQPWPSATRYWRSLWAVSVNHEPGMLPPPTATWPGGDGPGELTWAALAVTAAINGRCVAKHEMCGIWCLVSLAFSSRLQKLTHGWPSRWWSSGQGSLSLFTSYSVKNWLISTWWLKEYFTILRLPQAVYFVYL